LDNFDNPKSAAPSIEELQAQLAAAQAAAGTTQPAAPAATPPVEEVPVVPVVPAEPAAVTVAAAPTQPDQQQAIINAQAAGFLSNIPAIGNTMSGLVAAADTDDRGSASHLFPILTQQGGNTGGAFQKAGHMTPSEAANLPEGTKPFTAVFIGYRFIATSWEDSGGGSEKKRPVFSCAIPASEGTLTGQVMETGKNYQFTKLADKEKYDFASSNVGHIRPQIEMLLFDPEYGELFTYQTCSHYNSAKDTRDQLLKNATTMTDGTQVMLPFIGVFTAQSHRVTTKSGNAIAHHYAEISKLDIADANARKAWDAWQQFSEVAKTDATLMDKVNDWFAGNDSSVSAQCRAALEAGPAI